MSDERNPTYSDLMIAYRIQRADAIFRGCVITAFVKEAKQSFIVANELIWLYDAIIETRPYDLLAGQSMFTNLTMIVEDEALKLIMVNPRHVILTWAKSDLDAEILAYEQEIERLKAKQTPTDS